MRVNVTASTHWNPPTSALLRPGESVRYGVALAACPGGVATRDAALAAAGAPLIAAVPGYTLATDMVRVGVRVRVGVGVRVRVRVRVRARVS